MRLFLAVDLPPDVKMDVLQFGREKLTNLQISPTREANLHITVKFLGAVNNENISKLQSVLDSLNLGPSFELRLANAGVFPRQALELVSCQAAASRLRGGYGVELAWNERRPRSQMSRAISRIGWETAAHAVEF